MKLRKRVQTVIAVLAISGSIGASAPIALGGGESAVRGGVPRAASRLHADIRGVQQVQDSADSYGNGVVMATSRWAMDKWKAGPVTVLQAMGLNWKVTYPKLTATLPGLVQQAGVSASTGTVGNISTGGATGIKGLFNALRSAGAGTNQAIGMIANAINESSLNPEADAMDSNGYRSYGLWQFNAASYPNASSLVTGNASKDMIAQIQFLFQVGGLSAASGSTPQAAAGNFAANFERCEGCEAGGAQNNSRVGNVASVMSALGMG